MKLLIAALFTVACASGPALAQEKKRPEPSPAQKAQMERMKDCNVKAKGMKGEERSNYMKGCLSGKSAMADKGGKMTAQQNKMKDCNAKAKDMKGEERKKFMSGCLKG
jgi:psiF repeat-containing protein